MRCDKRPAPDERRMRRAGTFLRALGQTSRDGDLVALRDLPVEIESYALDGLELDVSSKFTRHTTVIRLRGNGEEGVGEDVTYGEDDRSPCRSRPGAPARGRVHDRVFSRARRTASPVPTGPAREAFLDYRRWAFESAALDLALRQAGRPLAGALGGGPARRLRHVAAAGPGRRAPRARGPRERPGDRFKLDPTSESSDDADRELADLGVVDSVDLKGQYKGRSSTTRRTPDLYRRVVEAFPDAWIEDPDAHAGDRAVLGRPPTGSPGTRSSTRSATSRRSVPPRTVNVKPSRFGSAPRLFDAYDYCEEHGSRVRRRAVRARPGRGQIQYLASSSTPTRRTTSRRADSTSRTPARAFRRARWSRRSSRSGSAGRTAGKEESCGSCCFSRVAVGRCPNHRKRKALLAAAAVAKRHGPKAVELAKRVRRRRGRPSSKAHRRLRGRSRLSTSRACAAAAGDGGSALTRPVGRQARARPSEAGEREIERLRQCRSIRPSRSRATRTLASAASSSSSASLIR